MSEDGIVVSQAESPYYEQPMQKKLVQILSSAFAKVHLYNYSNLSYPGGFWSFSFASKGLCPLKDFRSDKWKANTLKFELYNSQLHFGAFALPQFMLDMHADNLTPLPELRV